MISSSASVILHNGHAEQLELMSKDVLIWLELQDFVNSC